MLRLFKPGNANGIIIYQWIDIKIGKKIICQIILKHEVSDTDAALRLFNLLITVFFVLLCFCCRRTRRTLSMMSLNQVP